MSLSSYADIWNGILLRCPLAGPVLARQWVKEAFRDLSERRHWSWLDKDGQFLFAAVYSTGTVSVTRSNTTVTGTDTVWTTAMEGRQFRTGTATPVYTITDVASDTSLTLDQAYGGTTDTSTTYEIWNAYQTVPSDFRLFLTLWDVGDGRRVDFKHSAAWLNAVDSQRSSDGDPTYAVPYGYDTTVTPPRPRYEFWPHQKAQSVYPYRYFSRPADLDETSASIPMMVRGDILLEMGLQKAACWPGPSADKLNPYFALNLAKHHQGEAERMIAELERQDEEIHAQNVWYADVDSNETAGLDADWVQSHAV